MTAAPADDAEKSRWEVDARAASDARPLALHSGNIKDMGIVRELDKSGFNANGMK
jgi:hypothetical protein